MNFLAHLYLSGDDEDIMIGNFIADSVKGKAYLNYRPGIQQGILLHRKIDELTDNHEITKELSAFLRSHYKKYSGIVIDIFYDHFLSLNWKRFSNMELDKYIKNTYKLLIKNLFALPNRVQSFLPIMIAKNRLLSYSRIDGLKMTLEKMAQHTSLPDASNFAIETLESNYDFFNQQFLLFFEDMVQKVETESKLVVRQSTCPSL